MEAISHRVQNHQYNDPEILEFFIKHGVEHRLVGDHLFIIRGRKGELAAGPGDWLVAGPGGEVEVEGGDYALRAQRTISSAKALHRFPGLRPKPALRAAKNAGHRHSASDQ